MPAAGKGLANEAGLRRAPNPAAGGQGTRVCNFQLRSFPLWASLEREKGEGDENWGSDFQEAENPEAPPNSRVAARCPAGPGIALGTGSGP